MRIQQIGKSALAAGAVVAIVVAGLFAGRLSANAFSHGDRGDFAQRMFVRVSETLSLSEEQKSRVREVLGAHASQIEGQITATAAARQALQDAIIAKPFDDAAARARALDLGRVLGDNAVLRAKVKAEIDPILTAVQREKLNGFLSRKRHRGDTSIESFRKLVQSGS